LHPFALDPAAFATPIREAVAPVDSRQPIAELRTMRTAITQHAFEPRLNSALLRS